MSALSEAAKQRPFSNGTEGDAWMSRWCAYCFHDHSMHDPDPEGPGCEIVTYLMLGEGHAPEALIPEPDDGRFALPSRMVCTRFEPCTEQDCKGDPGAEARAERVAGVTEYWRTRA